MNNKPVIDGSGGHQMPANMKTIDKILGKQSMTWPGAVLPVCRVCKCTELTACTTAIGPCYWVEDDLCSACEGKDE